MPADDDFGLPCPGQIQPQSRWTETAIGRLPLDGPFDWKDLFGRDAPVILDLGCGNGRSTIGLALTAPENNFLGCDSLPVAIRHAVRRANQRGLSNIRFAVCDARELLVRLVAPGSVAEIHIYHPQPYYDLAQVHRRLLTPDFLAKVYAALRPGGQLTLQTDNPGYSRYLKAVAPIYFEMKELPGPWPEALHGRSRREILARGRNLPIWRAIGVARIDLDLGWARQQAEAAPPPVFDADRRLRELDELE